MYRRRLYKSLVNECCNHFKTRGEGLDLYKHELRVTLRAVAAGIHPCFSEKIRG